MASSRQDYFILQNDVPISKTNSTLNAQQLLKGELLVKETQAQEGSHGLYSLALDNSKKVSCSDRDLIPLSEDDYEWLVAIEKPLDRLQVYTQRDMFEAVKKMQLGDRLWVTVPVSDGAPSQLVGFCCCQATVQYIGPLQDMPGRWAGVELKEKQGDCDGSFRGSRYFSCDPDHGKFLPAKYIMSVTATASAPPVAKKLLLPAEKAATCRDFYLDDQVSVFDKDGKRVPGVVKGVKWDAGMNGYIIGIETDTPIEKKKLPKGTSSKKHLFDNHDYKQHSYLAMPEQSVLDNDDGTPKDDISSIARSDATDAKGQAVTSTVNVTNASAEAHSLKVDSPLEVLDPPRCGITGIEEFPGVDQDRAGVQLIEKMDQCQDGSWKGPSVQLVHSCECQLVQEQVAEIKEKVQCQDERIATVQAQFVQSHKDSDNEIDVQLSEHKRQVRGELATVKGQVDSCEEALQARVDSCEEALQARVDSCEEALRARVDSCEEALQARVDSCEEALQARVVSCEEALLAKDQENEELQRMITDLREELRQRETAFTARLSAIETQMRALQLPWVIPEADLEVTETILGKGAYGEVREGVYHCDRVAVKRLHNVIASDYYHKMIQREMGIAARLRHPKLVLFIGAVTTGNLTIVTELMETSLRSELEHGHLKEAHLLPISHDVACALCYLHSLPEPIIHRDVSSANVLLNSKQGGWTAKLGDYGSANFLAMLQTVGPGCPVYAAPEASRPKEQGPKMDVYSYGVLLLEICTGTPPDPHDLPVIQQAVHTWEQLKRQLGELACQCTLQSCDGRPHMRTVVTQLNQM